MLTEGVSQLHVIAARRSVIVYFALPVINRFSSRCGTVLDERTAKKMITANLERSRADEIIDRLIQDREFRDIFRQKSEDIIESGRSKHAGVPAA